MSDFIQADQFCNAVKDGTHDSPKKTEQGVKLVTSKNIIGGRLDLSSAYFISDNDAIDVNKRSKVDVNDILISMIGTVGEVCLIDTKPNFVIKNVGLLKLDNPIKAKWLYFYLTSKDAQKIIRERLRGTTQQYLPLGELRKLPILLPKNDQHMLNTVSFLSAINDKIHLNTQTNQTLEAIAQAIFKSWFVDFDPVRAKAQAILDGKTNDEANLSAMAVISGKAIEDLTQPEYQQLWEIADAFPSELVENAEFGEVPKGWKVKPLPEIIDFLEGPGIRNWQYTESEDGIKFINIRCIKNNDLSLDTANKITKEEAFGKYAHFQLKEDDIVISTSGTLGRFAFVRKNHLPLCLNTSVIRFRPIENVSTLAFITGFVETQLQYELEIRASGSAQKNFGPMHLKQIVMLVPDFNLLSLHQKFIYSLFEKRKANLDEIDNLAKTRDLLLPKLLSGEIKL